MGNGAGRTHLPGPMTAAGAAIPAGPATGTAGSELTLLPTTVIGGWLGSGKTTLVNHLLRTANDRRIAVLVNDFGEVSIDADLIEGADGGVLSLAGGCMCCSWGDDLFGTLARVRARQPGPDVLLVETSGVAQPASVGRLLRLAPGLSVEGTVVLADADSIRRQAADPYVGDLVRQQLADADLLLVTKPDLAGAEQVDAVKQWLGERVPGVRVIVAPQGQIAPGVVLGLGPAPPAGGAEDPSDAPWQPSGWRRPSAGADARFESGWQSHPGPVDVQALGQSLCAQGSRVVRAKGILTGLDGQLVALHVVGRRFTLSAPPARPAQVGRLAWIALR